MAQLRVAVLISGRGSNLETLIQAVAAPDFPAEIVLVVSNVLNAEGLKYAVKANIPTSVINRRDYTDSASFEEILNLHLRTAGVEVICLAGFMQLLTTHFVTTWFNRILNIHPSLLPAFRGLHTHERAINAGVRFVGCTVHFVHPSVDTGPIIAQAVVPVLPRDTTDILEARVLEVEHRLYPIALKLVATGKAMVTGDTVDVEGLPSSSCPIFNPEIS